MEPREGVDAEVLTSTLWAGVMVDTALTKNLRSRGKVCASSEIGGK